MWLPGSYQADTQHDSATVIVSKNSQSHKATFPLGDGSRTLWQQTLDHTVGSQTQVQLDVVYLIDATGSMDDEIHVLKETLDAVAADITQSAANVSLRMGMVAYRDRGDAFITKKYPLTSDIDQLRQQIQDLSANGGGDHQESLNEGLHEAISHMDWRGSNTVKLVFLIADAGPHLDYQDDENYADEMRIALNNAIKVHTVACRFSLLFLGC